jgi:hypothetical protein
MVSVGSLTNRLSSLHRLFLLALIPAPHPEGVRRPRGVDVAQCDFPVGGDDQSVLAEDEWFARYSKDTLRDTDRGTRTP